MLRRLILITTGLEILAAFALLDYSDGSIQGWPWAVGSIFLLTLFLVLIRRRWYFLSALACWWFIAFSLISIFLAGGPAIDRRIGIEVWDWRSLWWLIPGILLPIVIPMPGFRKLFAAAKEHARLHPDSPYGFR